jgi:ADP-heptose:LPS heptosyltransferase
MPVSPKRTKTAGFAAATRGARRVLLLDLGFLGDSIHLLPSLWVLREAYPDAELHVMVSEHVTRIMDVAPWVDRVWGYPRYPRGPKWYQDFGRMRRLRAAKFDVVVNVNGSDRSSILTRVSGARWRLGRRPEDGGPMFWPFMFSHVVEEPYQRELISTQRWNCLKRAGYAGEAPELHIEIPPAAVARAVARTDDAGGWVHVSPFTTENYKELPPDQLAAVVRGLQARFPERRFVLTCAGSEREKGKMRSLVAALEVPPWRVFAGELDLLELSAVVERSALHLGGDSGGLHVAWMTGVPTVTWFRRYDGLADWRPVGPRHRDVIGERTPDGLAGIATDDIVAAAADLLAS